MRSIISFIILYFILIAATSVMAQESPKPRVVITGARFTYPLVNKWIEDYKRENPSVEVVIAPRTTQDPAQYDLLIEAVQPSESLVASREFVTIGRYLILPFANTKGAFAKTYGDKGLTRDAITNLYFHNAIGSEGDGEKIAAEYVVYTRLQKASAPSTFARFYGFEQGDISGKGIAGADEHLISAVLTDELAVSYAHAGLLYNLNSRKVINGLTVLPVDIDGNGRISEDEKIFDNLDGVLKKAESTTVENIPVADIHLSISRHQHSREAIDFLNWVIRNSANDLTHYGFIKPEAKRFEVEKAKFQQLAAK